MSLYFASFPWFGFRGQLSVPPIISQFTVCNTICMVHHRVLKSDFVAATYSVTYSDFDFVRFRSRR